MNRFFKRIFLTAVTSGAIACGGCAGSSMHENMDSDFLHGRPAAQRDAKDAPQSAPVAVTIDNFSFNPPSVTVPAGGTVIWTNHDDVPHTVVSIARDFSSKALDTDDQYTRVFPARGTFAYFCSVHPHMTGQVIVK